MVVVTNDGDGSVVKWLWWGEKKSICDKLFD